MLLAVEPAPVPHDRVMLIQACTLLFCCPLLPGKALGYPRKAIQTGSGNTPLASSRVSLVLAGRARRAVLPVRNHVTFGNHQADPLCMPSSETICLGKF
jgi:hypothetical protein